MQNDAGHTSGNDESLDSAEADDQAWMEIKETQGRNKMKNVILTIDTEGPRGSDPVLYQIWGKVGTDSYYGIPKIIEICDKYHVKGLFFVDIPEIWDCGYEKIKEVIRYIREKGHDVGVHVHPHHMPGETRQFLFDFTKEEQRDIIEKCTQKYIDITGEFPISFRAGKYGANRDTLDIINELGYQYDFSEFYSQRWCGIQPQVAYVLPQKYKSLTEFPVTIFKSVHMWKLYHRYDKLEATINNTEMKYILKQYAHSPNPELITLFLHSFSLIHFLDTPDAPTVNEENIRRFEETLRFVHESDELRFIREADLKDVPVPDSDSERNIIRTKGIFRQLYYFYLRAYSIRKTNKKARLLIVLSYVALAAILSAFVVFAI